MAIAFVQQKNGGQASGTTLVITLTSAPTAGNCLICWSGDQTAGPTSITSTGATWVQYNTGISTNNNLHLWYALNVSSGAGAAITINLATQNATAVIAEFSGVAASSATDGTLVTNTTSGTTMTTGSFATTNANDLLVAGFTDTGPASYATPTNSFTQLTSPTAQSAASIGASYRIVTSTGSYSTGFTESSGDGTGETLIGAFKGAAGGGTPTIISQQDDAAIMRWYSRGIMTY